MTSFNPCKVSIRGFMHTVNVHSPHCNNNYSQEAENGEDISACPGACHCLLLQYTPV
jgi:hypothetical protein